MRIGVALIVGFGLANRSIALEIVRPPASQTIFLGDPVSFRVEAQGQPPLQYRWMRNGKLMDGVSGPDWTFITSAADHDATITVEVIDSTLRLTSPAARLTIDPGLSGAYRTGPPKSVSKVSGRPEILREKTESCRSSKSRTVALVRRPPMPEAAMVRMP